MQRYSPALTAVVLTLVTRLVLWDALAPGLFSPEELFNAELAEQLVNNGSLARPVSTYQYTAHAGGSLVVSLLHVPFAWVLGVSETSLKCVALSFALATSGLWTAAACRHCRLEGWLVAMGTVLAPLHLAFRQLTALGNHAEALALMGGVVLLLQSGRWVAVGALLGFGVWFDRTVALFAAACLLAVPWRQWWKLLLAAAVGALPLWLQGHADLPGASLASQFALSPRWELPLLPPLTGGPHALLALLWAGSALFVIRQDRPEARVCVAFVVGFMAMWTLYTAPNWHVQTVLTLPLLYSAASVHGRWRPLGALTVWGFVIGACLDGRATICPENLRAERIDGLALMRNEVWFYTPAMVPELQAWLDDGAPEPEVFGRYFQYSADSPGLFSSRFFGSIKDGELQRDICFSTDEGFPTVDEVDAVLGEQARSPIAERARRIRALE